MRMRLVEVLTREAVLELPDCPLFQGLMTEAGARADRGELTFTEPHIAHRYVAELSTDDGGTLVLNHEGRVLITDAARAAFADLAVEQPAQPMHIDLEDE